MPMTRWREGRTGKPSYATVVDPPSRAAGRVVIISASAGAGHDGASRELASRLRGYGLEADCLDLADLFPLGIGRLLQGTYQGMVSRAPWVYGLLFAVGGTFPGAGASTRALLRPVRRRTLRALPPDTRAVVSTYPIVSQVVGPLRRQGRIDVPVLTYLTDFAVNPIWISPGVDLHCAAHPATEEEARDLGAERVQVVGRLVGTGFRPGSVADRRQARERFGLPVEGRLALLVAGSWGVGAVAKAAAEIARSGAATPVVVCGRNEALRRRLRRRGVRYAYGWVDEMPELLRAADVLVENAGGLTALEAMASGLPILTYRPIPGHGRANAATMARAGVATWVRRPRRLRGALIELADEDRGWRQREAGLRLFRSDPAAVVAAAARPAGPDTGAPASAPTPAVAPGVPAARPARRMTRTGAVAVVVAASLLAWRNYARTHGGPGSPPGTESGPARPARTPR